MGQSLPKWGVRATSAYTQQRRYSGHSGTSGLCQMRTNASLDCLVSAAKEGYGYRETECFGGLEIDHEL
jgi:hypothetical protein